MLALPEGNLFALSGEITEWLRSASRKLEPQREMLREVLRLLACAYRDILLVHEGCRTADIVHQNHLPALEALASRLGRKRIMDIIESVWAARRQTDCNASLDLVVEALLARVGQLQQVA